MKNKQIIIIASVLIGILVVGGGFWWWNRSQKPKVEEPVAQEIKKKKKISAPQNVIELAKRPVVTLQPFTKDGGRFVSIVVSQVREPATLAEYEIVYNVIGASAVSATGAKIKVPDSEAQEGLQGFGGELNLSQLPTKTENRFGTCSAGGACVNNSVSGGTLTLNFDSEPKYGVTTNWTYFETGKAISSTEDGKFTMSAPELAKANDYLIMQAIGLPEGLPGEAVMVADGGQDNGIVPLAWQINFTKEPTIKEATLKIETTEGTKVAVWDGKQWSDNLMSAAVPVGNGYIYVMLNK